MSDPTVVTLVEQYLTPLEAAGKLSLSLVTIRRLERDGKLRGVRLAGRLRFAASALAEYVAACSDAPRRLAPVELLQAGGRPRGRGRR